MPISDPRFTIHSVSVQKLPASFPFPKKRLSHTVKAEPSNCTPGMVTQPIARRSLRALIFFGGGVKLK